MQIKIQQTSGEDFREIRKLLKETNLLDSWFTRQKFEKLLKRNNGFCLIAKDGEKHIGSAFGTHDGAFYGYIYKIVVARQYRRHKIASNLIKGILKEFKEIGIPLVFAHVEKINKPSIKLLQSLGFEIRESHYLIDKGYKPRNKLR